MTPALVDLRQDFPILNRQINGHPLVYLDSAATSQKPRQVLEAMNTYYQESNANVLRSVHTLAEEATTQFTEARAKIARFIGASRPEEVIFTRGTTESLNLVARAWGDKFVKPGDELVISPMEHHSNLIPWQQLAKRTGATLKFMELEPDGSLSLDEAGRVIGPHTKLVALSRISNVLGAINPIEEIAQLVHAEGGIMVVDGAQSVPHEPTQVGPMGADFLAFSGHKMCGPTGIGVLWGRTDLLEASDPVMFGGEMISFVDRTHATWAELPQKFEAGTPDIAGAIGLGAAVDYLSQIGMESIRDHSLGLSQEAFDRLDALDGVTVYGPRRPHAAVVSFNIEGVHPHDVSQVLDSEGVAIRAGHHCAQPLLQWLGVGSAARASFYLYNSSEDVDALLSAIGKAKRYFSR